MAYILLLILAVEVAVVLVNAIGVQTVNNLLWILANLLPVSTSKLATEQKKKQIEYLKLRAELKATSSQDEFAKWAKLRRQHDKLLEELEKMKKSLEASRTRFDGYVSAVRLLATRAPQWLIPMWYAGTPVFWLPHGLFPHTVEWLVALPKAPTGSVSPATWQLACSVAMGLLSEAVKALVARKGKPGVRAGMARLVAVPATEKAEGTRKGTTATGQDEKAEL